ncbi:hypothetical protein SARC_15417, partial [Sphaeroforma arctica JP610]
MSQKSAMPAVSQSVDGFFIPHNISVVGDGSAGVDGAPPCNRSLDDMKDVYETQRLSSQPSERLSGTS